ncbi:MAG: flavodoxin family protein [Firmicutes bacterium]|nr:flavodoxin family protein [Bacillota bacterium]
MKVLLLNGSPNAKRCTFTALNEVAGALEANGIETEIIHVIKGPIHGCTGCRKCAERHRCVFDGDLVNEVCEKMARADALVIGSPVYYASPNGAFLAFLDRLFCAGGTAAFAYKPGAAVVSARRAGTTASLDALNKYFLISNMPLVPSQYWNMVHGNTPEEVRRDDEGMQTMRTLGRNMAWLIKCAAAGDAPPETEAKKRTNFIR